MYLPISVVKITNIEQQKEQKQYSTKEAINQGIKELSELIESKIEDSNKQNILRNKARSKRRR